MIIEFGDVQFESDSLFKQLRSDLRDDWFPDPLRFGDMLDSELVADCMTKNFALNQGRYVPRERDLFNVPKPNFTLRYALETSLSDRALYHGLALFLMPFYDRLIPWNAFSHRYDYDHRGGPAKSPFKRPIPSWKDFVGSVRSAISTDSILLSTDLINYYEYIDIGRLQSTLLELLPDIDAAATEKAKIRARIDMLFSCLGAWTYTAERGLPQNRDASSFLANLYMLPVDRAMRTKGYRDTYFRYMDDIKIVCYNRYHARKALKDLILALRDIGLAVNPKKTEICDGLAALSMGGHINDGSEELQYLDQMWNTRSREPILRCIPRLKNLTIELIRKADTDSREFRFCIKRLECLALCDDLFVPSDFFLDVTPAMIDGLIDNPASTDQFARYLAAVPVGQDDLARIAAYLRDETRALYNWQNYQLWSLLSYKSYQDDNLLQYAAQIVKQRDDSPTRAGATLYCGAHGTDETRATIAETFRQLSSFLGQRSALIATHELPYRPAIETYVKPHVRQDLVGVYKHLRQERGTYYAPIERVPLTRVVDLDREYE